MPTRRPSCPSPRPRPATWPGSRSATASISSRKTWSRSARWSPVASRSTTRSSGCTRSDRGDPGARLAVAGRGRQPARRLVRHHRDHQRRRTGPALRPAGRGQGQHRGRGRPDDERLGHRRGLRPAARRHGGHPAAGAGPRSRARRSARTCASAAAATPPHPGRCATRGTLQVRGRVVQREPRRWSRPAPRTSRWAATRAARSASPASFCGTVGHKPTHGLVPYTGAFPIENTLDHLGPITRTVRDAALMLGVLAGPDGLDPRQRAGPAGRGLSWPPWTRA